MDGRVENGKKNSIDNLNLFGQYFFQEMLSEECRRNANAKHHQIGEVWNRDARSLFHDGRQVGGVAFRVRWIACPDRD